MTEPVPRSLHEHDFRHLEEMLKALDRVLSERITAVDREFTGQLCSVDRRHSELAGLRDKAVDAALAAANEKDLAHNDVLGAMKEQQSLFCTKETAASMMSRIEAVEKHQIADISKDKGMGGLATIIMQLLLAATLIISIVVFFANR